MPCSRSICAGPSDPEAAPAPARDWPGRRALAFAAFLGCVWLFGCGPSRNTSTPTLAEILTRHTEARGGHAAIEAIHNLEARLRIVEPASTVEGIWRVDRKGRMRIDVFAGDQRVWTEGYDGHRAWQMPGGSDHGAPAADGASALRHSAQLPPNLLGLHEMEGHGHKLRYLGRDMIDGTRDHVILLTLDDGFTTTHCLDPDSFLITRARVRKALHPDADPTPTTIETVWSDFRETAGVQTAFHASDTDLATGRLLQTTTLLELKANPPLDEKLFQMP